MIVIRDQSSPKSLSQSIAQLDPLASLTTWNFNTVQSNCWMLIVNQFIEQTKKREQETNVIDN